MSQPLSFAGFTVYQASDYITIRPGFDDIPGWQIICSCRSYEQALEAAQNAAQVRRLPLIINEDLN